jgi:dTMP kinase
MQEGRVVVADRFELSSFAYQGGGRHVDEGLLHALSLYCDKECLPDLIIFFDIKPELGLQRAMQRGQLDRMEQESMLFFQQVYDSYHHHIKLMKNVVKIDASKPLAVVQNLIGAALQHYLVNHAVSSVD